MENDFLPEESDDLSMTKETFEVLIKEHNLSMDKEILDSLVQLGFLQLFEELPNGLTPPQFDEWLNGITNNQLGAGEVAVVHALAHDMTRATGPHLWTEDRNLLHNRITHAKRAAQTLRSDEECSKNKEMREAYPDDKFAPYLLETAFDLDAHDAVVLMAFTLRANSDIQSLREIWNKEIAVQSDEDAPSFYEALAAGEQLINLTKELLAKRKELAEKQLMESQAQLEQLEKKKARNEGERLKVEREFEDLLNEMLS